MLTPQKRPARCHTGECIASQAPATFEDATHTTAAGSGGRVAVADSEGKPAPAPPTLIDVLRTAAKKVGKRPQFAALFDVGVSENEGRRPNGRRK